MPPKRKSIICGETDAEVKPLVKNSYEIMGYLISHKNGIKEIAWNRYRLYRLIGKSRLKS